MEIQQDHSFYHIIKREYRITPYLAFKNSSFLHPSYLSLCLEWTIQDIVFCKRKEKPFKFLLKWMVLGAVYHSLISETPYKSQREKGILPWVSGKMGNLIVCQRLIRKDYCLERPWLSSEQVRFEVHQAHKQMESLIKVTCRYSRLLPQALGQTCGNCARVIFRTSVWPLEVWVFLSSFHASCHDLEVVTIS